MDLNELKDAVSRVNSSLRIYEKDYVSCKRTLDTEKEVCRSFEQFVEIRFNLECSKIPCLNHLIEETQGHLFVCDRLDDPDLESRKFKEAHLRLITPDMIDGVVSESLKTELEEIVQEIGGYNIVFNSVKKKIKFKIY